MSTIVAVMLMMLIIVQPRDANLTIAIKAKEIVILMLIVQATYNAAMGIVSGATLTTVALIIP
jgi:hypothetical protein